MAEVVVAPGNAGTTAPGTPERAPIRRVAAPSLAPEDVVGLARAEAADLVVIGPEAPLCEGVIDALAAERILAFGPNREAARLEASKVFLKEFASRHGIPTAPYRVVRSYEEAEAVIRAHGAPIVVKADGLCAGKGVVVAASVEEALDAARAALVERRFGASGEAVVLEDVLVGEEASLHAITDGSALTMLPAARDHKRIFDGDAGPNTGGMGAFAPSGRVTPALAARIEAEILRPTLDGMRAEGRPFRGVLFAGLMITPAGAPMLLEHNVRFGDPECEVLMELLEGDVAELLASAAAGALRPEAARVVEGRHALTVVLAARGYPGRPAAGDVIHGLDAAAVVEGATVHHAGTAEREGSVVTAGGRVLAVTASGDSLVEARTRAYRAADAIDFAGRQLRRDIGADQAP
ncbi:Phosphoribosylamine--glycine ligase [Chondromyces apiculatus DSM 436]|uniref:Phosphoribosylamine--glycine ligase n=1 Tax=Chondromyces apiculatus DSM 436 TaxID=1192034 RepID=A0A017SUH8_9BACT|nr:Phosphoribosylamine--glycine ligase [Chondromyces apiculatus DSM 436]